jgi:transcriptional regulator with XRE-family HTH domain
MWRPKTRIPLHTRLKKARQDKNMSVDALTKEADITYITYSKIETWKTENPTISNIVRVARVLDISIDELTQDMYLDTNQKL